ncbi:hypothetical protein Bpfe_029673, partial [Biomphalaria pfeifferi]
TDSDSNTQNLCRSDYRRMSCPTARECSHVVPGALRTFLLFISTPETGAATTTSVHCSVFNVTREREFHMREKKIPGCVNPVKNKLKRKQER